MKMVKPPNRVLEGVARVRQQQPRLSAGRQASRQAEED
jgi:hypothetical protein